MMIFLRSVFPPVKTVVHHQVGSGLDPSTTVGPVITADSVEAIDGRVQDAVAKGAQVLIGGTRSSFSEGSPLSSGNFYDPTIIANATIDMRVFRCVGVNCAVVEVVLRWFF
jgi:acyl-CoA reductase-like NAD-dependent aldehyde dehydrogenase